MLTGHHRKCFSLRIWIWFPHPPFPSVFAFFSSGFLPSFHDHTVVRIGADSTEIATPSLQWNLIADENGSKTHTSKYLPAEICATPLPSRRGILIGTGCGSVWPSPSCPSLLLPQPQTSPFESSAIMNSAPTDISQIAESPNELTTWGKVSSRVRRSLMPMKRAVEKAIKI